MSFWNTLKSMFGFGNKDAGVVPTETVITTTAPVTAQVEVTSKPTPAKKPRKPRPKSKTSAASFEEAVELFKTTLDKKKKPYFTKLVKEYTDNTDADLKNRVRNKITNYMNRNK